MMSKTNNGRAPASPLARLRYYRNTTKSGRATAAKAQQTMYYYAYGAGRQQAEMRGQWYSPDGRTDHGAVMAWVAAQAQQHSYTYQAVLSVRDGELTAEDFCQVMGAAGGIADWRLVQHGDTNHRHAHVLFFRDRPFSLKETVSWSAAARQALAALEQERLPEQRLGQAAEQQVEPGWQLGHDAGAGWE